MNMSTDFMHQAVLLDEAIQALNIKGDGIYIDGTFGRGGHSRAILENLSANGHLLALDKDPEAIHEANRYLGKDVRFKIIGCSFADIKNALKPYDWVGKVDGILLDLGVSSPQLDDAARGFSFQKDGPLDMRMDPEQGQSAAQWLKHADAKDIIHILKVYGEEKFAKRIATAIVERRTEHPIETTRQLAELIAEAVPVREKGKDPATRSFQAIRIFINRELEDLDLFLDQVIDVLKPGGRLVIISFHSLEDRRIKRFMRKMNKGDDFPPGLPVTQAQLNPRLKNIGKAIKASEKEVKRNVRARSAVMRIAERLENKGST
jgi:16S rRNA (cytosine1402-N4)-methyltransferase